MTLHETERERARHLSRLPGEFGPILQLSGDLNQAAARALEQELSLLAPLTFPLLVLDVSRCGFLEASAAPAVLRACKHWHDMGRRMVIIARPELAAWLLHTAGLDYVVPMFPDEASARLALYGGTSRITPSPWADVWTQTIGRWRMIQQALDDSPVESILHLLLSMTALCRRSDALYCLSRGVATNRPTEPPQGNDPQGAPQTRCEFCPLFHQLGGKPEDVGCQSIVNPIIAAVRAGDRDTARAQVAAALHTIERMPAPEEAQPSA